MSVFAIGESYSVPCANSDHSHPFETRWAGVLYTVAPDGDKAEAVPYCQSAVVGGVTGHQHRTENAAINCAARYHKVTTGQVASRNKPDWF